ncbi:MAG: hypothetical protein MUP09_03140 [Thiovulaceae bacterium]|nr:hypothetical protein [Sulfurimonadaceae bacterium]
MQFDWNKRNVYLATAIIASGLVFMIVTGYYIMSGVSGGSSVEMAIDRNLDECYKEKGLN